VPGQDPTVGGGVEARWSFPEHPPSAEATEAKVKVASTAITAVKAFMNFLLLR
jgi:hypothetical protein